MRCKCLLFIFIFVLLPVASLADTHAATSCSLTDVTAAYNAASAGDTVAIPAGTCTWTSTLNVTKSIKLIGAGSSSTVISRSTTGTIINVSLSTDVPVRISGIGFTFPTNKPANYMTAVRVSGTGLTQIRIDHNAFTKGQGTLWINGQVYGVADNNTFTNVNTNYWTGPGDSEWNRATMQAGTANAFFFEDNTIIVDNGSEEKRPDAVVYIQEGSSVVVRYNTFDASGFTTSTRGGLTILNNHGNQGYYAGSRSFRASPIFECYNNTISTYRATNLFGVRGGSVLIYNNTITSGAGGVTFSKLNEEEAWQTAFFPILRTTWPAQDQVFNSFYWKNTLDGSPAYPTLDSDSGIGTFIQRDRDYFLHAPQSSGGYEYFTGSRKGGSTTAPTTGDTGSMAFSSSGANAYYPYTPYTYPHPLREASQTPKNLKIVY